jgi:hypothetical protein
MPAQAGSAIICALLSWSGCTVLVWLPVSDPSLRWQVLRDLAGTAPGMVGAERSRVAAEGWGARLLALRDDDGQWARFRSAGDPPDPRLAEAVELLRTKR